MWRQGGYRQNPEPLRNEEAPQPQLGRAPGDCLRTTGQLEASCRVPGHGLRGRKCIAVAADSAAKIKNTKPDPLAITTTMTSPMPYPPDAASMARATPTMRNNAANIAWSKKKNL